MVGTNILAAWVAGGLDLGFAAFHVLFWRLFDWPGRLAASGQTNAAITQTLNIVLVYIFVVAGISILGYAWRGGPVPASLAWAAAVFWLLRTILQPVMFSMRNTPSRVITFLFAVNAAVHAVAAMDN
jgi:hypothetical protein